MKLQIVSTPIGNLSDITFRAIESLQNSDLIICEDTRHTKILLDKYEIKNKKIASFHAQSSARKSEELCKKIVQENLKACYVSDAGTPCISDPGFVLIREALKQNISLEPIPGVSALTTLVSVAGVPVDNFIFYGFLPHKKGRQTILKEILENKKASIFYESVHRFPKFLQEFREIFDEKRIIVVGRELTKMYESIFRGTINEALDFFDSQNIKGEFVIIISGK